MNILSIDFGTKKIGLSSGNFFEKKVKVLSDINLEPKEKLLEKLKNIIKNENIKFILLGIPSVENPSKSWIYKKVFKFCLLLKKELKIPLILFNEENTTKEAKENFKKKYLSIHSLSSKILLKNFFKLKW
jgi:putative Holliday junction resolvase